VPLPRVLLRAMGKDFEGTLLPDGRVDLRMRVVQTEVRGAKVSFRISGQVGGNDRSGLRTRQQRAGVPEAVSEEVRMALVATLSAEAARVRDENATALADRAAATYVAAARGRLAWASAQVERAREVEFAALALRSQARRLGLVPGDGAAPGVPSGRGLVGGEPGLREHVLPTAQEQA